MPTSPSPSNPVRSGPSKPQNAAHPLLSLPRPSLVVSLNGFHFMQSEGFEWIEPSQVPSHYQLSFDKSAEAVALSWEQIESGRSCLPPEDR